MIEFALCIPFLLLALFAIIYFGRAFFVSQMVLHATQEGARLASRTPNLDDGEVRDALRGFSVSGQALNSGSVIYAALAAANLLSSGSTGDLPEGSAVKILPWDGDGSTADSVPEGTVAVKISYPFKLLGSSSADSINIAMSVDGSGSPVRLPNLTISEQSVASQELSQEVD